MGNSGQEVDGLGGPDVRPEEKSEALTDLTKRAAELKEQIEDEADKLKAKEKELSAINEQILGALEAAEVESLKAHGYVFFKKTKTSVTIPKTLEEKKLLFDFLESKGLFNEMVSVNSKTLNTLYKTFAAAALEEGQLDFRLPGVGAPTYYTTLELRKYK